MNWGLTTIKDIAEFVSFIVTSFSLAAIYFSYFHSKKQIHFAAIDKCISEYRELYQKYDDKFDNPSFLGQYIDLVNEELFYIENGYLPREVAEEWIDGMIDYLPFITPNQFKSSKKFLQFDSEQNTEQILFSYPRIYRFVLLPHTFDFEIIFLPLTDKENLDLRTSERLKLIKTLYKRLRKNKFG